MNIGNIKIRNIISNIITLIILVIAIFIYRKYDFNFFIKGIQETGKTTFSRDSKIKTSKSRSYKIENETANDAMFYKEISVTPNTPYKVTCKIKTENVQGKNSKNLAGAQICLTKTEEHSVVLTGNNDWTLVEFMFNSKNNDKVEIGFRLGGNFAEASGTAWFSDITLEKGVEDDDSTWNFGCFLINNADVTINDREIKVSLSEDEKATITRDLIRLKSSIKEMSNNQININYEIIEVNEVLDTLAYDEINGYYISEADVYKLIASDVLEKQFDHVFVCTNLPLESELTDDESIAEWIGLGNMMFLGKGFSNIRITPLEYQYSSQNTFPEEVFIHEFLHTLERNAEEYGYERPALHDYKEYGYEDDRYDGQRKWYIDYMNKNIKSNGEYVGLPSNIYTLKPVKESNFEYSYKLDSLDEPHNIIEEIKSVVEKIKFLFKSKEIVYNIEGVTK